MNSYKKVFEALEKASVDYIIVGGVAMNLLGCPRFTNDIDILLALDENNITKMKKVMKQLGYEQRLPINLDELGEEKNLLTYIREKNIIAYTFIHTKEPLYSVDIILSGSMDFRRYKKNRMMVKVWEMSIPVVSIDDLIGLKKETERERDALDIANLLELKGL